MANDLTGRGVWKLDTAAAAVIYAHQIFIKQLYWKAPSTDDHGLVLRDKNGKIILDAKCEAADQSQIFFLESWHNGLQLETLDSGVLWVYSG